MFSDSDTLNLFGIIDVVNSLSALHNSMRTATYFSVLFISLILYVNLESFKFIVSVAKFKWSLMRLE